jgi:hypothetical protein
LHREIQFRRIAFVVSVTGRSGSGGWNQDDTSILCPTVARSPARSDFLASVMRDLQPAATHKSSRCTRFCRDDSTESLRFGRSGRRNFHGRAGQSRHFRLSACGWEPGNRANPGESRIHRRPGRHLDPQNGRRNRNVNLRAGAPLTGVSTEAMPRLLPA